MSSTNEQQTRSHGKRHCGAEFFKAKTAELAEPGDHQALGESAARSAKKVNELSAQIPGWQDWREAAAAVKLYAISNLDKLLVEFEKNISARGVEVLYAKDAEEANRLVIDIAKKHNVKNIVKSKTMVSEEMALNHALADEGIRAVETDLGEYLVQLADERPSHIVTPAIHLSADDCGKLFADKLDEPYTAEHQKLTDIARRHLREEYIQADMGISGVNFAIADTGTIAIIENEGNAGLSTSAPSVHLALMGIEKIIPSIEYLPVFFHLLGRSGTGQKLTTYTHLIHGASPGRKMYLVILDNGRTNDLADPATRTSLGCLRCGACLNNCPVYQRVGGWAYGWVYPGPIGSIITTQLLGMEKAGKLPFASSLCGACSEACPVKIDIPHQLVHLRKRVVNESGSFAKMAEGLMWKGWAFAMGGPLRYRLTMKAVRIGSSLAKFLPWHPLQMGAWTRGREIPKASGPAFRDRWKKTQTKQK
ncbi:MAG: lactate utilization protein [Pirellulales bacterium]|nr:lactate utilization protein [Pirellulales bacterium]